jgi:hypothetical protein
LTCIYLPLAEDLKAVGSEAKASLSKDIRVISAGIFHYTRLFLNITINNANFPYEYKNFDFHFG